LTLPPTINHDPEEPAIDRSNRTWWAALIMVIIIWGGYLAFNSPDWWAIAVGGFTGIMLTAWAIETTGNKLPPWWH
jgi:hypothetical protein